METLLLEMFDCLSTELSSLLQAQHQSGRSPESETALRNARIAHLRHTLDRLQAVIGPEGLLLH
jgi:hypothetical protein